MMDLKKAVEQESEALTELLRETNDDVATRVTVEGFKRDFLPLLQNVGDDFNIGRWIELLGHPHCELHVIDNNNEIKYRIPAMLEELNTPSRTMDDPTLSAFAKDLGSAISDNPMYADRMLLNRLNTYTEDKDGMDSAIRVAVELNKVFTDFGMPLLPIPKTEQANAIAIEANNSVEYDQPEVEGYDPL